MAVGDLITLATAPGPLPVFAVPAFDANGAPITAYLPANAITDLAGNEVMGNISNPVAGSVLALLTQLVLVNQAILKQLGGSGAIVTSVPGSLDGTDPNTSISFAH